MRYTRCDEDCTRVISQEHRRAIDCAAEVADRSVTDHYGNRRYDPLFYVWKQHLTDLANGVIYDDCIDQLNVTDVLEKPNEVSPVEG